jgi:hypothetical protein
MIDEKYADAFDVIDLTQEEEMKARGRINWNSREDRMAFFSRLAAKIADHTTFIKKPGAKKTQQVNKRLKDDIQHLFKSYGKTQLEAALLTFGFSRDETAHR